MSSTLRIGLVQTQLAWEKCETNIEHIQGLIRYEEPVDLILLPEMWSTGFSMRPEVVAEQEPGPALQWMIEFAVKFGVSMAGSIAVRSEDKYYNRFYCVHPDGQYVAYDKRHLFSFGKEDQHYTAGTERILLKINNWKVLPIICYDLRFPVWCRNTLEYDLLVVVANWPTPRIHHWDALLKARAIENQSYIAAVNRIGVDGSGLHYPGHSSIYDMNGMNLLDMKDMEGMGVMSLDRAQLHQYREHFRFLPDRDSFQYLME